MIAIITARGGSKGLPRKNVLPLCGQPLIAYTIQAAIGCAAIERVIVSTDDPEIADVARHFGAEVPFMRPAHLATDTSRSRDVILHALEFLQAGGESVDNFCLLQPTSPLRDTEDIGMAVALFHEQCAASVLSVVAYEHPIQWAVELDGTGRMFPRESHPAGSRQAAKVFYRPNGALYVFDTAFFQNGDTYIGADSFAYVMPQERSVDIDTRFDFVVAEALMKSMEHEV